MSRLLLFALSVGGYLFMAATLYWGFSTGRWGIPGGDTLIWDRVGDIIRNGGDVYAIQPVRADTFWYAPPFAVIFGAVSWLPAQMLWAGAVVLEVAALRYIAGSWRAVGYAGWFPLVAFEFASGNWNMVMAAAICAAVWREPRPAAVMSFAKLAPVLAIHPRDWRPALITAGVMVAITLPWFYLWPEWVAHLVAGFGQPLGPQVPVPFVARAAVALALLALWRPWSRALAATIAIPAFYWVSFVVLLAPLAVWLRQPMKRYSISVVP